MSDENNIFDENDMNQTQTEGETNTQSQTEENNAKQQNTSDNFQYNYNQDANGGNNQYQQYNYQQGGYQQGPYQQYNPYQQVGPKGKKVGVGFGIASLVLGIISLVLFCTCINIIFAIIAIVFGIIQIVKYEKKGMAIAGIATAGTSILLFIICVVLLTSNEDFINSLEREIYTIEDGEDSEDVQQFQKFLEKYSNGNYDVDIQGSDEDGDYSVHVTPNEDGTPDINIETQDNDTL